MYKVWQKRAYPKIPSIGESTPETVVETMIQSETCVSTFYNTFLTHNCVPLSQYLEFLGKLFFAILYTYCGAHSMPVPQSFMCNASVTGVNLFIYQIGFYAANLEECVLNSFFDDKIIVWPWAMVLTSINTENTFVDLPD